MISEIQEKTEKIAEKLNDMEQKLDRLNQVVLQLILSVNSSVHPSNTASGHIVSETNEGEEEI